MDGSGLQRVSAWRERLRADVTPVQIEDELLLLDRSSSNLVRLDRDAARGLADGDLTVAAALDTLGLTVGPDRRQVLTASALAALGISITALPAAAQSASPFVGGSGTAVGDLDTGFTPFVNPRVITIVVQSDGKILIGGEFTSAGGQTRNRIARLNADGTADSFNPNVGPSRVEAIAVQPSDGSIIFGGAFNSVSEESLSNIARVSAAGALDDTFIPGLDGGVKAIAIQSWDDKIIVSGAFTTVDETSRIGIARLNLNGTLDTEFVPAVGGVNAITVLQSARKILIGGQFTTVNGVTQKCIARLNEDGSLDDSFDSSSFDPNVDGAVNTIAIQPSDGKIVLGGTFTTTGGTALNRIARLDADGALDTGFSPNVDAEVTSVAIQTNGAIIIGGYFTAVAGTNRTRIARINADGSLDTNFDPAVNGGVMAVAVQSDGKILFGGSFSDVDGEFRRNLARIA